MGAQHRYGVLVALTAFLACTAAQAVTLQAAQVAGALGATDVKLPVSFLGASGKSVSAVQFTMELNPKQFEVTGVALGPAAEAAGKQVWMGDMGQGEYVVIVFGLNQTPIPSGVLAVPVIRVRPKAAGGTFPAALTEAVFSDPGGQAIPGKTIDGSITVFRRYHSADLSRDYTVSVSELLRVIQLFNFKRYHCAPGTEDGYAGGPGPTDCAPHSSDFNPADWTITISELLRLIQFFNAQGYHIGIGTEDGFMPGRAP